MSKSKVHEETVMKGYQITFFTQQGSSPRTQVNGRDPLLTVRDLGLRGATIVAAREGYD